MKRDLNNFVDQIDVATNEEDLKRLCDLLELDYDNVAGDTKRAKIRELVLFLNRRSRLPQLYNLLKVGWPNVEWTVVAPEAVFVPIVVVAMTREEAEQLAQINEDHVTKFMQGLGLLWDNYPELYKSEWVEYYSTRQEWRPFFAKEHTISEIIWDVAETREGRRADDKPKVYPLFRTDEFFAPEFQVRRQVTDDLRVTGALVVVDPISLYHPVVAHRLQQSGLAENERAAFLIASPFNLRAITLHDIIEARIAETQESLYDRFHVKLDDRCEYGVGDIMMMQRWLYSRFGNADTHFRNPPPRDEQRPKLRQLMGEDPAAPRPTANWGFLGKSS